LYDRSQELLSFVLEESGLIAPQESIQASGNILDLASIEENDTILVSIDSCHEPGSIKDWKNNTDEASVLVEEYIVLLKDGQLVLDRAASQVVNYINKQGTARILAGVDESMWQKSQKAFSERLYSLHNLRKRPTGDRNRR
jgi:tRNA (guanine-N(7)-)-methyltransferase subunit TRM82